MLTRPGHPKEPRIGLTFMQTPALKFTGSKVLPREKITLGANWFCDETEFTKNNTIENLGFSSKRWLLESDGVDVLRVYGSTSITSSP